MTFAVLSKLALDQNKLATLGNNENYLFVIKQGIFK